MADVQKFLDQAGVSTLWSRIAEELNKKAVAADVYTKSEVDAKIDAVPRYDDTALAGRVSANEDALAVLNGDSSAVGSVAYQIAQIVAGADADFDTLKEIADWIAAHPDSVSALQSQITDNKNAIADLSALVGDTAVATQIANAIADANLSQYATAADLAAAVLRISTNESDIANLKTLTAGHTTDIGNNATAITNLTNRVDGIVAGGGEPNLINTIKVNGAVQTITDKAVDITVPVVQALTTEEIDTAIANAVNQA